MTCLHYNRFVLAVAFSCLICAGAAANEISCKKSGVAFDYARYSGAYEFICKKETVDEDSFDKMRASKTANWQELIDYGRAFLPPKTLVEGTIMSSREGRYGSAFMVTAIGSEHLTEPSLKRAVEAISRVYARGAEVTWRSEKKLGDYDVDFYGQNIPSSGVGGGPRECMGFVRYIDGSAASHDQRVIGTYCEVGSKTLDDKRAMEVLGTLLIHPEVVQ